MAKKNKPNSRSVTHHSIHIMDESGRLVGYKLWAENKGIDKDGTPHTAQSPHPEVPSNSFEFIKNVPDTYNPASAPVPHAKHKRSKKSDPLAPELANLPVLFLDGKRKSNYPHDGLTTQERCERLAPPCQFCGKFVVATDWETHMRIFHAKKLSDQAHLDFLKQRIVCQCKAVIPFNTIAKHWKANHLGVKIIGIGWRNEDTDTLKSQQAQPPVAMPVKIPALFLQPVNKSKLKPDPLSIQKRVDQLAPPCLICKQFVVTTQWEAHMRTNHANEMKGQTRQKFLSQKIRCQCGVTITFDSIARHWASNHCNTLINGIGWYTPPAPEAARNYSQPPRPKSNHKPQPDQDLPPAERARWLDDDERMDGSKYLGHLRRQGDGTFGSFPLHDDYTDEADAD